MKAVFMGTPDFAAAILQKLIDDGRHSVIGVYTQPDRPAGRGHALKASAVKSLALQHNIPVFQPINFKEEIVREHLKNLGADVFLVAAYGLILPQSLLDMPKLGAVNVHGSLLPRWRGAAPIQRAIMAGDKVTGISIMQMEAGLDSGPILLQRALGIGINDTAATLHDELAALGGELLLEALDKAEQGALHPISQDEAKVSYAAKLSKTDGFINFDLTVEEIHARLRGVTPWPGARAVLERRALGNNATMPDLELLLEEGLLFTQEQLKPAGAADVAVAAGQTPGVVLGLCAGLLAVQTANAPYGIAKLRPAGGKSLSAADFANGYLKDCTARLRTP